MLDDVIYTIRIRLKATRSKVERAFLEQLIFDAEKAEEYVRENYYSQEYIDDEYIHRDSIDDLIDQEIENRTPSVLCKSNLPENVLPITQHDRYRWAR